MKNLRRGGDVEGLKKLIHSGWTYGLVKGVYVLLFFYAGVAKLFDPQSLAIVIDAYGLVPDAWVMPIAVALPAVEIVAAMWAKKLGYKNVYRHPGGIFAWKGAKYPTEAVK